MTAPVIFWVNQGEATSASIGTRSRVAQRSREEGWSGASRLKPRRKRTPVCGSSTAIRPAKRESSPPPLRASRKVARYQTATLVANMMNSQCGRRLRERSSTLVAMANAMRAEKSGVQRRRSMAVGAS
jgi:hypothetical protein